MHGRSVVIWLWWVNEGETIWIYEHLTAFLHNGGTNLIAPTGDDTVRSGEEPHLDTHTWK